MKKFYLGLILILSLSASKAQPLSIDYFLPPTEYLEGIQHPGEFLSHLPGEWHLTHDQLVFYSRYLSETSNRVIYQEYAKSHENRPLFHLIISHPENISNLENIKEQHRKLADPDTQSSVDINSLPSIVNLGYNVHGNEQSSVGASVYVAWYLTAGKTPYIDSLLRNTIILLDPCLNPDGMNRFSSWVNMHKGKNLVSDPVSREFNEPWPGSRTNHYWFDLNRDWLPLVHPESKGRVKRMQEWLPNIVSDYHEMGTNATYFFQPGVKERTNPLTPQKTMELTAKVAEYHSKYLDKLGTLYYSGEQFDDFYYGKGSTYPDVQGAVGILFEQASSRGHLQESIHGLISYPYTIRNQIYASLSSLEAGMRLREELLIWKRDFFKTAFDEAAKHPVKAYIFGEENDNSRLIQFVDLLLQHNIDIYNTKNSITAGEKQFAGGSYIVPLAQRQHRLIRSIFETVTEFQDSIFYDISSWTMPLAMHISYAALDARTYSKDLHGGEVVLQDFIRRPALVEQADYAYIIEWKDYFAPALLYQLLEAGTLVKASEKPFTIQFEKEEKNFDRGTLMIPIQWQKKSKGEVREVMQQMSNRFGIPIYSVQSGRKLRGIDLGSSAFNVIKPVKIALLTGSGLFSNDCGEIWYTLDVKYNMKVTLLDVQQFGRLKWAEYTHLLVGSGNPKLSESEQNQLKDWIRSGGTIIASGSSNNWLKSLGIIQLENVPADTSGKEKKEIQPVKMYEEFSNEMAARRLSGAIFSMDIDPTHPLFYGYDGSPVAIFKRGTDFVRPSKNNYATPARFSKIPLLSGYVPGHLKNQLSGHAAVMVHAFGGGRVISYFENPLFRGFWLATNKSYMNAIFFGSSISRGTAETGGRDEE
jgi:hypothetical protein